MLELIRKGAAAISCIKHLFRLTSHKFFLALETTFSPSYFEFRCHLVRFTLIVTLLFGVKTSELTSLIAKWLSDSEI